ncbi:hypothetical protein BDY19DRAFT_911264 [Irpex rosettiformis]|uniref:Uncharacterized protein n=1 Tax=Irpex rosettiformis TaxID=378272 RepID=A0ACB8UJ86_9APHY|nr:hypothetical protein BDY19DRAFT_911264 [Irpex rosettiformis]
MYSTKTLLRPSQPLRPPSHPVSPSSPSHQKQYSCIHYPTPLQSQRLSVSYLRDALGSLSPLSSSPAPLSHLHRHPLSHPFTGTLWLGHEMSDVKVTFINKFTKEESVLVFFCALGGVCTSMTTRTCCRLLESFDDKFFGELESKARNLRSRTSNLHCILRQSHVPSKDHRRPN